MNLKRIVLHIVIFILMTLPVYGQRTRNFGNYPVDYPIAFFDSFGYSKSPTVRDLFISNPQFHTSFQGNPARVEILNIDIVDGLLGTGVGLYVNFPYIGEVYVSSMSILFSNDDKAKKSIIRVLFFNNHMTDDTASLYSTSVAGHDQDINIFRAFLAPGADLFWDLAKFR